jgi:hypothetical protein
MQCIYREKKLTALSKASNYGIVRRLPPDPHSVRCIHATNTQIIAVDS